MSYTTHITVYMTSRQPTICLNMIVRNESRNMSRLFDSLKGFIDDYVIVDTGSTDNTVEVIKKYSEENKLKGQVLSEPFKNFGYNRTHALEMGRKYSQSDYLLLLDADMTLVITPSFDKASLREDTLTLIQRNNVIEWANVRFIRRTLDVKCVGVTHEYYDIRTPNATQRAIGKELYINDIGDGGCKSDKFERDVRLLTQGLIDEPNNGRYYFYLAQSYHCLGKFAHAITNYQKRVDLGGWPEEVWYSHYKIAESYLALGKPAEAEEWVNKGYRFYPRRAEAILMLAKYFRIKGQHAKALQYVSLGKQIARPDDKLFVEYKVYEHLLDVELSIIHYYVYPQRREEGLRLSIDLLNRDGGDYHNMVYNNMHFYINCLQGGRARPLRSAHNDLLLKGDKPEAGGKMDRYLDSSPSMIRLPSGETLYNVRRVNYSIDRSNGNYSAPDNLVHTHNDMMLRSADGSYGERQLMKVVNRSGIDRDVSVQGLEDVRIYPKKNGQVGFTATTQQYCRDPQRVGLVTGTYDYKNAEIIIERALLSPDSKSTCEKNWLYLDEDHMVYKWSPLQIGRINGETGQLEIKKEYKTPKIWSHFRGSSNAVAYRNLLWLAVHFVYMGSPRRYIHCLVALRPDTFEPVGYSLPFKFEDKMIEYSVGMTVDPATGVFEIGYSLWDSCANAVEIPFGFLTRHMIVLDPDYYYRQV